MKHKVRIRVITDQRAREVNRAVLFRAGRFWLSDDLDVHVWSSGSFKLCFAGYKGNLELNRVCSRNDLDHFARYFWKFQTASRKPRDFSLIAAGLEIGDYRSDGHVFARSCQIIGAGKFVTRGTFR